MALRMLVGLLVAALVVLPVAQHASTRSGGGHAAALKHAPRTPPSAARVADVARRPLELSPAPLAGFATSAPPARLTGLGPAAPFVPPRV
jgi:hypothetical protein